LILMIWRPCDLNMVMILASKSQDFNLEAFNFTSWSGWKTGIPTFKDLPFWSKWRHHDQI
jgi:hypothetical protein